MKKSLAGGHENGQKAPATAMSEPPELILRGLPLVAELEAMIAAGKGWSREFEERVDQVSIALFGITRADTEPSWPALAAFYVGKHLDEKAINQAASKHYDLMQSLAVPNPKDHSEIDIIEWWEYDDIDVTDDNGRALRCLHYIDRQLWAAFNETIPGAKLTLDGKGTRAPLDAERWGNSLADEARKFAQRKRD